MTLIIEHGNEQQHGYCAIFPLKKQLFHTAQKCPSLTHHEIDEGEYEVDNPEHALELLSELQEYAASHPLVIEWPMDKHLKIRQRLFADKFLKIIPTSIGLNMKLNYPQ